VFDCGFDAGDCGTRGFHKLHELKLKPDKSEYTVPNGMCAITKDIVLGLKTFFIRVADSLLEHVTCFGIICYNIGRI
jgi:hypothetical protein